MSYVSTGLHRAVTIQRLTGSRNNAMSYVNIASRIIRSSPLFDRSELVCRRWGWEKFWLGRIRKRASPAENKEKKLRNSIACENSISRALGPCTLHTKTHAERKNQPFPTFPKGCGPRMRATLLSLRLKKSQIYLTHLLDACGWEGRVGLFRIVFSQLCCRSESMPISPFFPTMFLGKPYLHVSGSFGYIFTFFGRL